MQAGHQCSRDSASQTVVDWHPGSVNRLDTPRDPSIAILLGRVGQIRRGLGIVPTLAVVTLGLCLSAFSQTAPTPQTLTYAQDLGTAASNSNPSADATISAPNTAQTTGIS